MHGGQFLPNFKLLNVILAQLMDCNTTIDPNTLIPVHKLGITFKAEIWSKLSNSPIITYTIANFGQNSAKFGENFDPVDCCCHHY